MERSEYNKSIGIRIKNSRKAQNITLLELGKKVGLSESTVKRYEDGTIKSISLDIIEKFSQALDLSPAQLMGWENKKQEINSSISTKITEYSTLVQKIPDLHEAIKLYSALDPYDRSEIRGEMKGMLRNPKYKPLIKEKTMG